MFIGCGKTSGKGNAAAARKPARFSHRKNGDPPLAQPSNNDGRPITQRVIASAKRTEKESEDQRIELARIPEIHSLFHTACRNKPTKDRFSRELEGGFWLQKPSLARFPLKSQLYPPCPQPSQSLHAPAALPAWESAATDIPRVHPSADRQ